MNKIYINTIAAILLVVGMASVVTAPPQNPTPGSGSIWTTNGDCGEDTQDENHYAIGEIVYINGDNFLAGTYDWTIAGQPGQASCDPGIVVASGSLAIDGPFCFAAYTIAEGDCGEYKADFDGKKDNYRVDGGDSQLPEFGVLAAVGVLALAGLFVYKRRN